MLGENDIKDRLEGVDPQLCAIFAVRCALRVLPALVIDKTKESFWYWEEEERPKNLLSILLTQQASVNVSNADQYVQKRYDLPYNLPSYCRNVLYSTDYASKAIHAVLARKSEDDEASADAAYAAAYADAASDGHGDEAFVDDDTYVDDAIYDYDSVNFSDYDYDYPAAANAAYAALHAADVNGAVGYTSVIVSELDASITSDLDKIANAENKALGVRNLELSPTTFLNTPLWEAAPPEEWLSLIQRFKEATNLLDSGFDVWIDWYHDRLNGKPLDNEVEEKWLRTPEEIKAQGVSAVNAYLSSLLYAESGKPLNLVRGIFIGSGAAGKTSLIRTLHDEKVVEGKEKMTPGIAIREWQVPNSEIKARFWDFGGQVMSHSTHQFFLRERCLYIIVLDARAEFNANDQAEYWLEHVKAFGKNAKAMLVGNKSDLTEVNLDMNALTEKYPSIIGFYPLSCTSEEQKFKNRFISFRTEMIEQLQAVGTHQVYFTENQFKVLETVRKRSPKQAFLSHQQFAKLCQKFEIGKIGLSQEDFLKLLDSLGEIIHFPTLIRLNAFVLNPRWLTYGVYTLLYAATTSRQSGELSENDVVRILQHESVKDEHGNTLDYPADKCGFIIDAMEEFKLCYRLSSDHSRFVIPDKLPTEQPDLKADFNITKSDTLAFEFEFRGFLPRHIMPSLIVTRHEDIVDNLVWQNGVVLKNKRHESLARVQVDYHQRVLQLWVQGSGRRQFLEILNDEINKILKRMEKLEYDEKVILPSKARFANERSFSVNNNEVEKAPYKRLMAEARAGQEITISDSGTKYDLQQVMGFIMSKKQRHEAGMHLTVNGNVGAIGGTGKNQKITGRITINKSNKKAIVDLQTHLTALMKYVQDHDADFEIKSNAYSELKQIREHLDNLEDASPETKGKLRQLLDGVSDRSSSAIKLGTEIRDADETIAWLMEKAAIVSSLLVNIG